MGYEPEKRMAARRALSFVRSGMTVGLGTGTTTHYFVEYLGAALRQHTLERIIGVPTSTRTAKLAREQGIPLGTLDDHPHLDVAVDGADEVDAHLNLIKGRGRALVREKIVEVHAQKLVIIVDESKLVERLGTHGPLPVEVVPFGAKATAQWIASLGCSPELLLNEDGSTPYRSDNGNYILFCHFSQGIVEPHALASRLKARPGVVDHGLFLNMAEVVIVGTSSGVRIMERKS